MAEFRLLHIVIWSRFVDYYENENAYNIFNKLNNCSLFHLHDHFNRTANDDSVASSIDQIQKIAEERQFNIWVSQPFVETNPIAPLKRYRGESWVNHPLE